MKTKNNLTHLLVFAVLLSATVAAHAGIFTWQAPTAITTADVTLNQSGTVVGSAVFGTDGRIVVVSSGTVFDFKADGSVATATGNGTAYGGFTDNSGNTSFNAVLTQFNFDGGPKTITLNNLVAGQQYSVQLFACDRRSGIRSTLVGNFQDPNDASNVSGNFQMGAYDYVIGTFTATAATQDIQENLLNSNGGNINALVVRQLSSQPIAPQITTQPQSTAAYNGTAASFTAAATGTGLTYQWQKGSVGGSVFTNLANGGRFSGATSNSLAITGLIASDTADYRLVVTNSGGATAISSAATLTVNVGTPQFVWSAPVAIGTADSTLAQSGTIVGAATFGATETVVTLTDSTVIDFKADGSVATATGLGTGAGAFSGNTGNANFNSVLDEFNFDGGPKTITLNNLFVGQLYSVQLFALDDRIGDGTIPFRTANFQSPADANNISQTFAMGDNAYIIGTFTASNTTVDIQQNLPLNNNGNINAVVVRALGVIVAPQITTQPQSITIDQGLAASFSVVASGSSPLTYTWQRGAIGSGLFTNVPANVRHSGLGTTAFSISNLSVSDSADYRVVVANAAGSVTSAPAATLTVQAVTPQFVWSKPAAITTADSTLNQSGTIVGAAVFGTTPKIVVLSNGSSVDFQTNSSVATATGAGTGTGAFSGNTGNADFNAVLTQFNFDGGPKTITLNSLVSGQQYAVQLFALDNRGGTTGRHANFQDPADQYDYSPTFLMGDNAFTIGTFTASGSSVSIQENLADGNAGNLNALVIRRLSGLPIAPQITTQPKSVSVFAGVTVQFTVGANGTSLSYRWQRAATGSGVFSDVSNVGNISGATTAQLTLANVNAGNGADYRVIVSNSSGSVTSAPVATLTFRSAATLIHRWNFNETSGTVAHDSVGTADGTLVTGSGTTASFVNGMLFLSNPSPQTTGAGSYVSLPGGLVTGLSAVTFEGWVTNSGLNNGNTLIGFGGPIDGSGNGANFISFFLRWPFSQNGFWISTSAGDPGEIDLGTRQQNVYVHWHMIYDPIVGTVQLYQNGVFSASASGIFVPLSAVGTSVGYIGYSVWNQVVGTPVPFYGNANSPYYNGYVDEVRIYDGALNTNAIAATQLLGANQVLSNNATLSVSNNAGNLVLTWPIVNGAFTLESTPALGPNALWTPVSGSKTVVGSNYQMTVPETSAAAFFRLRL